MSNGGSAWSGVNSTHTLLITNESFVGEACFWCIYYLRADVQKMSHGSVFAVITHGSLETPLPPQTRTTTSGRCFFRKKRGALFCQITPKRTGSQFRALSATKITLFGTHKGDLHFLVILIQVQFKLKNGMEFGLN